MGYQASGKQRDSGQQDETYCEVSESPLCHGIVIQGCGFGLQLQGMIDRHLGGDGVVFKIKALDICWRGKTRTGRGSSQCGYRTGTV